MATDGNQQWWRDPRTHFGRLDANSPVIHEREAVKTAISGLTSLVDLQPGAHILDLGCGPGRYAVELAHQGFKVTGVDINEEYIALARQLAAREGVTPEFEVGDMRNIGHQEEFDAVISVGTSFGFFDLEEDNELVVAEVARALVPQGLFVLEMGNHDFYLKNFMATDWKRDEEELLLVSREFDYLRSRINTKFELYRNSALVESWSHSWRAYTLAEINRLFQVTGLTIKGFFGDWQGKVFNVNASRCVVIAQKHA